MKDLLYSKKFWVALVGLCLMILNELLVQINVEEALAIITPLIAYVIGQGIADRGKEVVKTETKLNGKKP